MKNAKGIAVLLVVLLAGALLGASGAVFYYERQFAAQVGQRPPHLHTSREKAERLGMVLGLSPAQVDRAAAIIESHEPEVQALHAKGKAAMDAILDKVNQELAPDLTPEQNERLAAFVADVKSRPFPPRPGDDPDGPGRHDGPGPDRHGGPGPDHREGSGRPDGPGRP